VIALAMIGLGNLVVLLLVAEYPSDLNSDECERKLGANLSWHQALVPVSATPDMLSHGEAIDVVDRGPLEMLVDAATTIDQHPAVELDGFTDEELDFSELTLGTDSIGHLATAVPLGVQPQEPPGTVRLRGCIVIRGPPRAADNPVDDDIDVRRDLLNGEVATDRLPHTPRSMARLPRSSMSVPLERVLWPEPCRLARRRGSGCHSCRASRRLEIASPEPALPRGWIRLPPRRETKPRTDDGNATHG